MKKIYILFSSLILVTSFLSAQNVGIGTQAPTSKLEIVSSNSGLLIPRVTLTGTSDVLTVSGASTSELVYNTATTSDVTPGFYYWNGSTNKWVRIKVGVEGEDADWYDNGGTAPTNINDDIYTLGSVGIGAASPAHELDIAGNVRVGNDTIFGGVRPDQNFNLITNGGIQLMMDNDNGGSERFGLLHNGDDSNYIFDVDEDGNLSIEGDLLMDGGGSNIIRMDGSTGAEIDVTGGAFDIKGVSGIDVIIDSDNTGTGSAFTIKKDAGVGTNLFGIGENSLPTVYEHGNGSTSGTGGGIRFRELSSSAGGSDYAGFQAPDNVTSSYVLTMPVNDGASDQVLTTDGSGILSWETPVGTVATVQQGAATTVDNTDPNNPIVNVSVDNTTIQVNGFDALEIIPGSLADEYIQNQDAMTQTGKFKISGDGELSDLLVTGNTITTSGGMDLVSQGLFELFTNTDARIDLDNDDNGSNSFEIRNGDNDVVFEASEGGNVDINGYLDFLETGSSPTFQTRLQSADLSANVVLTLPNTDGNVGEYLQTDGGGVLSWSGNVAAAVDVNNGLNYDAVADKIQLGGALVENTTIPQGAFTLDFTTSAVDGFSVDGTTFSVDGTNNRIGIGTAAPDAPLTVGDGTNSSAYLHIKRNDNPHINLMEGSTSIARMQGTVVGSLRQFQITSADGATSYFNVNQNDGNVGIGTTDPDEKMDINGLIKIRGGSPGIGKVLRSDANGVASWVDISTAAIGDNLGNHTATQDLKVAGSSGHSIYTWTNSDANWRIGMSNSLTEVGFARALATSHVQYATFGSSAGQGFAVGDVISDLSSFEVTGSGNDYKAYFRGNVGIGATNPTVPLHVKSNADGGIRVERTSGKASIEAYSDDWMIIDGENSSNGNVALNYYSSGDVVLSNGGGDILIGAGGASSNPYILPRNPIGGSNPTYLRLGSSSNKLQDLYSNNAYIDKVRIGSTSATNYPLEVSGTVAWSGAAREYSHPDGGSWSSYGTKSRNVSIYSNGSILVTNGNNFIAASDERIKKDIKLSNTSEDLSLLNKIKISDYSLKDSLFSSRDSQKKVIAQQIEQIFPQAITKSIGSIPNIYEAAKTISINGNEVAFQLVNEHGLRVGERVRIYNSNGEMNTVEVINCSTKNSFTVNIDNPISGNYFIYGKEVDDFLSVDYDALSMLNISATQELIKRIGALEKENTDLKTTLSNKANNDDVLQLKSQIEDLKELILNIGLKAEK